MATVSVGIGLQTLTIPQGTVRAVGSGSSSIMYVRLLRGDWGF